MKTFRATITRTITETYFIEAPSAEDVYTVLVLNKGLEPDESLKETLIANVEVLEVSEEEVRTVTGLNGPLLVNSHYYDLLRSQDEEFENFVLKMIETVEQDQEQNQGSDE